jgi:hypothetical protein
MVRDYALYAVARPAYDSVVIETTFQSPSRNYQLAVVVAVRDRQRARAMASAMKAI